MSGVFYRVSWEKQDIHVFELLRFRNIFPRGLPTQLSLTATIRMPVETLPLVWDLVRIVDGNVGVQFKIEVNGRRKSIRMRFPSKRSPGKGLQSVDFTLDNVYFDKVSG